VETEFGIQPIERVDDATMRQWEDLAQRVRDELSAAGVRLEAVELHDGATADEICAAWERASGASVSIDPEKYAGDVENRANIWIAWRPDGELRRAVQELILKDVEAAKQHPALIRYGEELNGMRDRMLEVLRAAGYDVIVSDDDMHPLELRVLRGPARPVSGQ
jgi:hypothetical protein